MSCHNCFWCRIALTGKKMFKCKLHPKKRFNHPMLHGWFCIENVSEEDAKKIRELRERGKINEKS